MDPDLEELVALLARGVGSETPGFTGTWERTIGDGAPCRWRVWRRGRLARVENPPGVLRMIAGDESYWRKWPVDAEVAEIPRSRESDDFELSAFTMLEPEDYWQRWLGRDPEVVARTLRAVRYLGRRAYVFTAPEVKGRSIQLTADAELGVVLRYESRELGVIESWSDFSTEPPPSDDMFVFDAADVWATD